MKKIFLQMASPRFANNTIFTGENINGMDTPWRLLKTRLFERGYELVTADDRKLDNCERIIFMDAVSMGESLTLKEKIKNGLKKLLGMKTDMYTIRSLYREGCAAGLHDKMLLIIWEGKSVQISNFYPSNWKKFKKIMTWDDELVDEKKFFKFYLPVPHHSIISQPISFNKKKLLVNISINKYSSYKAELYSVRRKSIAYFDTHHADDFDLYGLRWNKAVTRWQNMFPSLVKKYTTYRGTVDDKQAILMKYKFALAYENNADAEGYVTEKIFDILQAKVIPIYLGAPNIDKYVPKNVFIDRRKFKDDETLFFYLKGMPEEEYMGYIRAGEVYLQSEMYEKSSPEYFCDTVLKNLNLPVI